MKKLKFKSKNILITIWLVLGLSLGLLAFKRFVWDRVGAQNLKASSYLIPPYFRLVKSSREFSDNRIMVDLMAATAGNEVSEADVTIEYDPNILSIKKEGISFTDNLWVNQINQAGEGRIDISLFSSVERGEPLLRTEINEEKILASFDFDIIDNHEGFSLINIDKNSSLLFWSSSPEGNILKNVEGVKVIF